MTQKLISKFEWTFCENSKILISIEDIRGQKIAIDARVWYDRDQTDNIINNNNIDVKLIFRHLYSLTIEQTQVLVVFEKLNDQDADYKRFITNCHGLLNVMSIPYVEVENVGPLLSCLVKEKIVDNCLTEDAKVLVYGFQPTLRFSYFHSQLSSKQPIQLMKYSLSTKTSLDLLRVFHPLAAFLFDSLKHVAIDNKEQTIYSKERAVSRPIRSRACKKVGHLQTLASEIGKVKLEVGEEGQLDQVLSKISKLVISWSENPGDGLKDLQTRIEMEETEGMSDLETELLEVYRSLTGKSLFQVKDIFKAIRPIESVDHEIGSKVAGIKWKRAEFQSLHGYLRANHVPFTTKHLLGYLVAFDFFQLLNSHESGDSYPEGIARPEKILKKYKKHGMEMYEVKWYYIPGTDELNSNTLVTMETKNIFCAAFPKVASKFEGWKSSDDDDDDRDCETFDDFRPIKTPGSPKKCPRDRKRNRRESDETPASTSSSKSTVNQYFVARKKLTFDGIK